MTVLSALTVVACLIVGALMVRYGNLALREQRAENRSRAARRVWEERERELHTALEVVDALAERRKEGLLVISDDSWRWLNEVQKSHPEYLEELLLYLDVHVYRASKSGRVLPIHVYAPAEVVALKRKKRRSAGGDHTPKDGLMIQPSLA